MMDTLTQVERLIELAIIQRSELRRLVEELPQLKAHLSEEIERTFEETEPQLRAELEEWTAKQTADKTAALGVALEAKIADLAKSLEVSTQARYNAIIAERGENARLAAQAEAKIAEHAASLPGAVKEIVSAELARFPRAGEIDQLRKEFAEPKSLNPRGKWVAGETYNKLDLVTINGDSYVSNIDGNTEKPSRSAGNWTLNAARGNSGGGGGITALNDLLGNPSAGDIVGSEGNNYVRKTLTAGTGITITDDPSTITIDASGAQEMLTATVKNAESVAITRGQVVYLFSATGGFPSVKLAFNTSDATSAKTFGVVSDVSIAPNGTGTITCVGVVSNLNLGAYNDGDTVYLGATPGSFTATKPYAPNHLVYVGIIERANAGNGELYVRIQNGYELDEIHDVQINNPRQAGQTLIYDATNSLWKNARLTAGVGVSITNADSSITISADGGVNYQGTWNASTNTPTLASSVGTKGFYYVVSVAGSTNLNGITDWQVGDWAIFNGSAWQKVDTTDQVSSVFGRTGAVVGVSTDYSSVGITNTAIGASNPSTGAFTTLSASSTLDAIGNATVGTASGGITGKLTIGNGVAGNSAVVLRGGSTQLAWQVGSNINNANSLELSPSTANGGTTFSSTVWRVDNSGNSTQSGNLTVSGTGPHTFSGRLNITNTSGNVSLVQGAGASGSNYGLRVQAGLNASDYGLFVTDSTSTSGYFIVRGDGSAKAFNGFEVGGNLTVSGTGTSSFSGILSEKTAAMTNPVLIGEMADSTTVGVVSFSNSRTSSAMLGIAGTTTDLFLAVPSTGTFQFRNGWTEQMRLFANGNLFIGASPTDGGQKLQVSGTANFSSGSSANTLSLISTDSTAYSATGYNSAYRLWLYGNGATSAYNFIRFSGGGSNEAAFGTVQNASGRAEFVWQTYDGAAYGERLRIASGGDATFAGNVTVSAGKYLRTADIRDGTSTNDRLVHTSSTTAVFAGGSTWTNAALYAGGSQQLAVNASATTLTGNLTVNGTGTSSFAGPAQVAFSVASQPAAGSSGQQLRILNGSAAYGLVGGVDNAGNAFLQSQRVDGTATTYALRLNYNGGEVVVGGNLTVSGTGTSSVAGKLAVGRSSIVGSVAMTVVGASNANLQVDAAGGGLSGISLYAATDADAYSALQLDGNKVYINSRSGGNVLLGTTTDSGLAKLQVAGSLHLNTADPTLTWNSNTLILRSSTESIGVVSIRKNSTGAAYNPRFEIQNTAGTATVNLEGDGNATFAGNVTLGSSTSVAHELRTATSNASRLISAFDTNRWYINSTFSGTGTAYKLEFLTANTTALSLDTSQNATFAGNIKTAAPSGGTAATWRLGTVASVSPTSPNRTIEVEIGGTTYYIHAKTTNN